MVGICDGFEQSSVKGIQAKTCMIRVPGMTLQSSWLKTLLHTLGRKAPACADNAFVFFASRIKTSSMAVPTTASEYQDQGICFSWCSKIWYHHIDEDIFDLSRLITFLLQSSDFTCVSYTIRQIQGAPVQVSACRPGIGDGGRVAPLSERVLVYTLILS